jgi:hypothetical protein
MNVLRYPFFKHKLPHSQAFSIDPVFHILCGPEREL